MRNMIFLLPFTLVSLLVPLSELLLCRQQLGADSWWVWRKRTLNCCQVSENAARQTSCQAGRRLEGCCGVGCCVLRFRPFEHPRVPHAFNCVLRTSAAEKHKKSHTPRTQLIHHSIFMSVLPCDCQCISKDSSDLHVRV